MTLARIERRFEALRILCCVALGLALCFAVILLVSEDPMKALRYLLSGPFRSTSRIAQIFEKAQPMLITGCALGLMMSVGNFSLINDSCVILAPCLVCAPIILNEGLFGGIPGELGRIIWITASCAGSALVGAAVSMLPPLMRKRFGCNEIVTSSLLNSVFTFFVEWFVKHILFDEESGLSASKPYPANARLTRIVYGSRLSTMIFIGLAFCLLTYLFLYHTRLGYAARLVGKNPSFARASGIDVGKTQVLVSMLAGAVAGMAGTLNTLTFNERFSGGAANYADGMFCGIFAKNNPLLLPVAAIGLSYLRVTAETMSNNTDVPVELVTVMTSFIIMLLAADQMFAKPMQRAIRKHASRTPEEKEGVAA